MLQQSKGTPFWTAEPSSASSIQGRLESWTSTLSFLVEEEEVEGGEEVLAYFCSFPAKSKQKTLRGFLLDLKNSFVWLKCIVKYKTTRARP